MFKVIIAGSRAYADYETLCKVMDRLLVRIIEAGEKIEIVSGLARGADSLGVRYAQERGYKLANFPAQWDIYGKSAGYKRNHQMAEYADAVVAFWDGSSRGTGHMINIAEEYNLAVRVYKF